MPSVFVAPSAAIAGFALNTLAHLSADRALFLLTLGLLLIYVELNRPGLIFAGAFGLLAALFALASLLRFDLNVAAIALVCTAAMLLGLDLLRATPVTVAVAATLALVLGFSYLVLGPQSDRIHPPAAVLCGLVLGVGTSVLTRIARRARANKGLD